MGTVLKEKRLRLLLDEYRLNTIEGDWITPLNPDNIKIVFVNMTKSDVLSLSARTIYLNGAIDSTYLFPCYIRELWYIKQRRECGWKYWIYKIFAPSKIEEPAKEKAELAQNWLCR